MKHRSFLMQSVRIFVLPLLIISLVAPCCNSTRKNLTGSTAYYNVDDYAKIQKYDTHIHINVEDSTFIKQARVDNFRLLSINVSPAYYPPIEEQQRIALHLIKACPGMMAYATTFSLNEWGTEGWLQKSLTYLKESFAKGAIAVKVWKNIGMELRDKNGKFVMIDDPRFDPILDYLEQHHITLIGHLGEPQNAWMPLDKMNIKSNQTYFSKHPEYHMYLHPEYPSYEDQINARDHMLEKHPALRFVGAHLGSLEWSTDELARRLDKFPNMAVDMAARLSHLQLQTKTDYKKVRDFFIRYQDRLIYATDLEADGSVNGPQLEKRLHDKWFPEWKFFVTDSLMTSAGFDGAFRGLKLPRSVVDKLYRFNAEKWFPGINQKQAAPAYSAPLSK